MDFMLTFILPWLMTFVIVLTYSMLIFLVSRKLKRYATLDTFWGLSFVGLHFFYLLYSGLVLGQIPWIGVASFVLVGIWGFRLFFHILKRSRGHGEDTRYQVMKDRILEPKKVLKEFVIIFLTQAGIIFLISSTLYANVFWQATRPLNPIILLGMFIWWLGYQLEKAADQELQVFLSNPQNKGQLLTTGVWSWSRHPNYFGDSLMWWGLACMGFDPAQPWTWLVWIGPVVMTLVLYFVSGVPLSEQSMKKKPGFASYARRTSIWFPWFPNPKSRKDY